MEPEQENSNSGSSSGPRHRHRHVSTDEKTDAVLRILKGEAADSVAHAIGVSTGRVERWHTLFITGGRQALKQPRKEHNSALFDRLKENSQQLWQWAVLLAALVLIVMAGLRVFN